MSDDLVKRLRAGCVTGNYEGLEFIEWAKSNATMNEAADRIEQLEEELSIWKSVFPDIAPERVQPDRSLLEKRIEQLEMLLRSFPGFTDDARIGDPWIEAVRAALEGKNDGR